MLPFTFRAPIWNEEADELACCSFAASCPAAWTVTPAGGPSSACVIDWLVRLPLAASDTALELLDWSTPSGFGAGRLADAGVCSPSIRSAAGADFAVGPWPICCSRPFRFAATPSAFDVLPWRTLPPSPERFVFSGATCTDDAQQTTADAAFPASGAAACTATPSSCRAPQHGYRSAAADWSI